MGEDTRLSSRTQQPGQIWDAALGELQLQVEPTAFETWFRETDGVAHSEGEFVVGAGNAFIREMLEHRMYPLIEQAIEHVIGEPTSVRFQVVTQTAASGAEQAGTPALPGEESEPQPAPSVSRQLPDSFAPPPSLNSRYTFERFVVGKSNELAHAAARAVADNPGNVYNPLVMYSEVGLGKTHLLHAIGHQALAKGMSLIYATTEEFTNEYIRAIREGFRPDGTIIGPPMPTPWYRDISDTDVRAIVAYLRNAEPVNRVVPKSE